MAGSSSARRRSSPTRAGGGREREELFEGKICSRHQSQALFVIVTSYRPPRYAKGGCSFRLSVECGRTKRHLLTGMKSTAAGRLRLGLPGPEGGQRPPGTGVVLFSIFFFSLSSARRRVHWLGNDRPESRIKFFKLYFVKCRAGVASRNWRFLILSCPLSIHPLEIVHPTPTWVTFNKNYRCVGARPKKSLFFL